MVIFFIDEVEGEAFAYLHQSETKLTLTLLVLISERITNLLQQVA